VERICGLQSLARTLLPRFASAVPLTDRIKGIDWQHQERTKTMTSRVLMAGVALLITTGALHAQITTKTEEVKGTANTVVTQQMTGEVVWVHGDTLVAKMQPNGFYSVFNVKPGREFMIDGQTKHIGDLKPGTVLTAAVTTTTQPVTARQTSSLKGTVQWVQGKYLVLTLPNGEHHEYEVADTFKFDVNGKPATARELRPGMVVSATRIVEVPRTEMSEKTVITGKAPK
jgi:DNA-binding beta-propeller fold protein YncE